MHRRGFFGRLIAAVLALVAGSTAKGKAGPDEGPMVSSANGGGCYLVGFTTINGRAIDLPGRSPCTWPPPGYRIESVDVAEECVLTKDGQSGLRFTYRAVLVEDHLP